MVQPFEKNDTRYFEMLKLIESAINNGFNKGTKSIVTVSYQHMQITRKPRQGFFLFANRNLFFQSPLEAQADENDFMYLFAY